MITIHRGGSNSYSLIVQYCSTNEKMVALISRNMRYWHGYVLCSYPIGYCTTRASSDIIPRTWTWNTVSRQKFRRKKTALVSIAQNTVRDLALDDGEYMTDAAPGNAITSCLNLPIKLERWRFAYTTTRFFCFKKILWNGAIIATPHNSR